MVSGSVRDRSEKWKWALALAELLGESFQVCPNLLLQRVEGNSERLWLWTGGRKTVYKLVFHPGAVPTTRKDVWLSSTLKKICLFPVSLWKRARAIITPPFFTSQKLWAAEKQGIEWNLRALLSRRARRILGISAMKGWDAHMFPPGKLAFASIISTCSLSQKSAEIATTTSIGDTILV